MPVYVIAAIVLVLWLNWPAARDRRRKAEAEAAPERIFAKDPAPLLHSIERGRMDEVLASGRSQEWLEKWVEVSGRYEGMADSLTGDEVHLTLLVDSGRRINLRFAGKSRDQLRGLRPGQWVTALAQVTPFRSNAVLGNAEIVRAAARAW